MAIDLGPAIVAAYAGAITSGLLHGLDPGHGWPLAVRSATADDRPGRFAVRASLVLSAGHFISTLVVVMLFFLVATLVGLLQRPLYLIGGVLLLAVAVHPYVSGWIPGWRRGGDGRRGRIAGPERRGRVRNDDHEGDHDHHHRSFAARSSLKTVFVSALVLGFIHEEEFALIGFVAAGANALVVGILYGLSVTAAIVGVTWTAVRLAVRGVAGSNERRLVALGHVSSAVMFAIGVYYLALGVAWL